MSLRRFLIVLMVALTLASPPSAWGQAVDGPSFFTPAQISGGVLGCDYASRSFSNTVAASNLYQFVVPGAYTATQTLAPTLSATVTGWNWTSSIPLHFRALGTFTSAQGWGSPGTINMGVNYGGTTASVALINGHGLSGSLVDAPWRLDVYLMPFASATTGGGSSSMGIAGLQRSGRIWAEFRYASLTTSQATPPVGLPNTDIYFATFTTAQFPIASATQFNVEFKWASAAQTNSINRHSACWKLGE